MKMFKTLIVMVSLASVAFAQQAEGPRELKVLTSQYERAVEKALDPITAKYLNALKRLKAKLAKEQKLEQALAVEDVISGVQGQDRKGYRNNKPPFKTDAELRRFLIGTSWGTKPTAVEDGLIFYSDGSFKSPSMKSPMGKYVISGPKTMSLIWSKTTTIKCEFFGKFSSFKELDGHRSLWTLLGRVDKR